MINIEEYQALAMRTSPEGHDRVLNGCLGLIGESGEIVDVIKKWKFQSGENAELPKDKLIDECGDVLWYCAELCQGLEIDLARVIREARAVQYHIGIEGDDLPYWGYRLCFLCSRPYSEYYEDYGKFHRPQMLIPSYGADGKPIFTKDFKTQDAPIVYPGEYERRWGGWRYFDTITSEIDDIVMFLQEFLNKFAGSSLEEAMEQNIEKLKKRYPEGFDPERSLHRAE